MWNGKTVSVVLPTFNEAEHIAVAVEAFLALQNPDGTGVVEEVLVVDNNSTDDSGSLAQNAGARVLQETQQGYGYALRRGLRDAEGELIVLCEPDGTFHVADLQRLLNHAENFEMVCGSRTSKEHIREGANMGLFLRWGNQAVAKLMQGLYGTPALSDCGCTFRLIHQRSARKMADDLVVGGSHFLPNMVIAARLHDVSFTEVPVSYQGRIGKSKITGTFSGAYKTGMAMIGLTLKMWPNYLRRRREES